MPLTSGTKLGPYEIQSALGAGGMGEVYRAKDVRLDRTVAVKVLASHLSSSPELKQRMEREARAISSLSHPNICHLYDIGSQDGTDYLVMEFLEGETLAERLGKGALPLSEILKIAIALTEGLAAAHRQGIVHRDLKPGNIMLTKSGAKLMDFGLAKSAATGLGSASSSAPLLSAAQTMTMNQASPVSPLTTAGTMIGTIQYMSPEQIEGKEADARSDLFALGAVLYEMATGARPFEGKSQISVASSILEKDPEPISSVQPLMPPAFEYIVTSCLAKNPEERIQTAHDVALQLKWVARSGTTAIRSTEKKSNYRELRVWRIVAVLALMFLALALFWHGPSGTEHTSYFSAPLPFAARDVAVSPNGHTVAIVGHREEQRNDLIWIYEPGSQESTGLANTEGATFPFWSADGQSLAFFADGKLKKLNLAGGLVQTLCDAPTGRGGTWNKDGVIVFTPSGHLGVGLYKILASGGTPTEITVPDKSRVEDSHRWPQFLPDGIHYLYSAIHLSGGQLSEVYVGSLNSTEKRLVTKASSNVAYVAPYLLYYHDRTLFGQHFDTKTFELTGEPIPILTDIQYAPRISRAVFAASNTHLLVAQKAGDTGASQFLWFNRQGQEIGTALKPGIYGNMMLSPNGKIVASDVTDPVSQNTDIWTFDLETQSAKRLTFDPAIDSVPIWSPDGTQMVFSSNRGVTFDLYLKDANGAQEEKHIPQDGPDRFPSDWSRDGKYVIFERGADLWFLTIPELRATQFLKASSTLKNGQFSPDGKWVAYSSNESGRWEVYVTSFPEAHGKWQVSNAGGDQPRWRTDGKELFYLGPDSQMTAVPVKTGANFDAGTPTALFQANPRELVATSEQFSYDVSKDGQKFLINTQLKTGMAPMSVVLNWSAKLN